MIHYHPKKYIVVSVLFLYIQLCFNGKTIIKEQFNNLFSILYMFCSLQLPPNPLTLLLPTQLTQSCSTSPLHPTIYTKFQPCFPVFILFPQLPAVLPSDDSTALSYSLEFMFHKHFENMFAAHLDVGTDAS